jgi:hypothetical protein
MHFIGFVIVYADMYVFAFRALFAVPVGRGYNRTAKCNVKYVSCV